MTDSPKPAKLALECLTERGLSVCDRCTASPPAECLGAQIEPVAEQPQEVAGEPVESQEPVVVTEVPPVVPAVSQRAPKGIKKGTK